MPQQSSYQRLTDRAVVVDKLSRVCEASSEFETHVTGISKWYNSCFFVGHMGH